MSKLYIKTIITRFHKFAFPFLQKRNLKKLKKKLGERCQLSINHKYMYLLNLLQIYLLNVNFYISWKLNPFFLLFVLLQTALNLIVNWINLLSITENVNYFTTWHMKLNLMHKITQVLFMIVIKLLNQRIQHQKGIAYHVYTRKFMQL